MDWINSFNVFQHLCHSLSRIRFKHKVAAFLRSIPTNSDQNITGPVRGPVKSHFFSGFFSLTVCVLIQLPESQASVCVSTALPFFPLCFLCPSTLMCQSSYLHGCQSGSLSVHVSARRDPLPLLLCRHLTFITAWPWLSLLSSLLWCSITLSSWGKHWCQATVMTFWLSVFMWWMRWKCTTTAKRGWRCAKLPHHSRGGWEWGGVSNKTNNIRLQYRCNCCYLCHCS